MKRRIAQPLKDDVVKSTIVGHEAIKDPFPQCGVQVSFGISVHRIPPLVVRCAHGAREITVVGGLHLKHAIASGLHSSTLSWIRLYSAKPID